MSANEEKNIADEPTHVGSINLAFQKELIEAYQKYDEIKALAEYIRQGCKLQPNDGKTMYMYNGKEFESEAEALEFARKEEQLDHKQLDH